MQSATLIEGPDDALLSYTLPLQDFGIVESCTISSDIAYCMINVQSTTYTQTQTASPFVVQGGGFGNSDVSSSSSAAASPQGSRVASSGPSQTLGPSPTKTANESSKKFSSATPIVWAASMILAKWFYINI